MATTADTLAAEALDAYTDAKTLADSALAAVNTGLTAANNVVSQIDQLTREGAYFTKTVPAAIFPKPAAPTDFTAEVRSAFDYAFGAFNSTLQSQILNFLTAFFPDIAAGVKTGSDQWIIDTITNGRYVPAPVETALWNRAKDKEVQEAARMEQEVIDASASRGFSAPSGTLAYTVAANQQELAKKLTTINRDIAIKAFDTANENTKFAIQQAVSLRTAFVAAMGDFIKVAMVQPNNAVAYAKVVMEAKTSFYDSAVKVYSAQVDEERVRATTLLGNAGHEVAASTQNSAENAQFWTTRANNARVKADVAMQAAEQLGRIAAAALTTRNSVVSVAAAV